MRSKHGQYKFPMLLIIYHLNWIFSLVSPHFRQPSKFFISLNSVYLKEFVYIHRVSIEGASFSKKVYYLTMQDIKLFYERMSSLYLLYVYISKENQEHKGLIPLIEDVFRRLCGLKVDCNLVANFNNYLYFGFIE